MEVVVPVADPAARTTLERILYLEWQDPRAWELGPHGAWIRRPGGDAPTAQEVFMAEAGAP